MLNFLVLSSVLWSLAAQAAPAPQVSSAAGNPCAVPGADLVMSDGVCVWATPPDVNWAATATGAGGDGASASDAPPAAITSDGATTAQATGGVTSVQQGSATGGGSSSSSVTAIQGAATGISTGAGTGTGTGVSSLGGSALPSGSQSASDAEGTTVAGDAECVATPNPLLAIEKPADDKWTMTGEECPTIEVDASAPPRYVAYWSQWNLPEQEPSPDQLKGVTHLVLSFAASNGSGWTPQGEGKPAPFSKTTVESLKKNNANMKVFAAFGGWGLDSGFSEEAATGDMSALAQRFVDFADANALDGIDLDWEFPVGGGQFYKSCEITGKDHLLDERPYEADAYVDLVRHIRKLGPKYEVSVALPGRKDDREVFQKSMLEQLDKCVNHFNLMSYDDMNRRDTRTKHHTGSKMVGEVVQYYNDNGVDKKRMNIGFASFAKFFTLPDKTGGPSPDNLGLTISPAEGPGGDDLGTSSSWFFDTAQNPKPEDRENANLKISLERAHKSWPKCQEEANQKYDENAGAHTCLDKDNQLFWTWADEKDIEKTCTDLSMDVGGVMLWSANQDDRASDGGAHIDAIAKCAASMGGGTTSTSTNETTSDGSESAQGSSTSATGASESTGGSSNAGGNETGQTSAGGPTSTLESGTGASESGGPDAQGSNVESGQSAEATNQA